MSLNYSSIIKHVKKVNEQQIEIIEANYGTCFKHSSSISCFIYIKHKEINKNILYITNDYDSDELCKKLQINSSSSYEILEIQDLKHNINNYQHAKPCPCNLSNQQIIYSKEKSLKIGVCVLVEYNSQLLITKRTANLRSFPSAWVFAGGGISNNENISETGQRELQEETNVIIDINDMQLLCIWESVFPPTVLINKDNPKIQSHYLVFYYLATPKKNPFHQLKFQSSEVDDAVLINLNDIQHILTLNAKFKYKKLKSLIDQEKFIYLNELYGIYPQNYQNQTYGIARGHVFALQQYSNFIKKKNKL